ncbi:MAG: hypothetical protein HRU80_12030 [Ignavibacteriales bacterium]|nr:MAG: hypothetical protein HRU80_12030 [Ignavibacteriales bacterium]
MKKILHTGLLAVLFSGILFYSGCDDTTNTAELDNIVIPASNVSYRRHIQPVFDLKCNNAGCHNDADRAGGLALTSHQNTTSNFDIVFPGEPNNSLLIQSIRGLSLYPMPPLNYYPLTKNQIEGITTWVREGAKDNP